MANKPEAAPSVEDLTGQIEALKTELAAMSEKYEGARRSQAGVDTSYQREKKRADEAEARLVKGQSEAQILARLDGIQKAYAARGRKLELSFYAKSKALDAGIDYELISDIDFSDEPAIEHKVAQIAEAVTAGSLSELDKRLSMSSKPQASGYTPARSPFQDVIDETMKGIKD